MAESIKKLIPFSESQIKSIEEYAIENELFYGGKPHISAAVRQLCAIGLGVDTEEFELKSGNPNFVKE